jgi:hypothetical protein
MHRAAYLSKRCARSRTLEAFAAGWAGNTISGLMWARKKEIAFGVHHPRSSVAPLVEMALPIDPSEIRTMRSMRIRRMLLAVTSVLVLACDNPAGPTPELGAEFTLAPGERAQVEGTQLGVTFIRVDGDSRCPLNAFCVWGGDALVKIEVESRSRKTPYDLHTGDMQPVTDGEFSIALVQLQPYPFSGRTTEPDDYRATLRVTK